MALQLIKISEFPEQVTIDPIEWMAIGMVDGEARKISFINFLSQLSVPEAIPTFTDSSFDI